MTKIINPKCPDNIGESEFRSVKGGQFFQTEQTAHQFHFDDVRRGCTVTATLIIIGNHI